jgi:hypothetical protein
VIALLAAAGTVALLPFSGPLNAEETAQVREGLRAVVAAQGFALAEAKDLESAFSGGAIAAISARAAKQDAATVLALSLHLPGAPAPTASVRIVALGRSSSASSSRRRKRRRVRPSSARARTTRSS